MRTIALATASLFSLSLLLAACGEKHPSESDKLESKVDAAMDDLRKGKEEASAELRELREDLAVEQAKAEERLKDPKLTAEQRSEWEAFKDDVDQQIQRIDRQLDDVNAATAETWNDVKSATKKAVDETGDWFKRQAEKIDRKTDADADHDGH
ncbi:MAG: hypothetical protein H6591_12995 [Flavobacteriales bacterium]|nr:hypothetical protein [Flavobacteriales bacterium]